MVASWDCLLAWICLIFDTPRDTVRVPGDYMRGSSK